MATVGVDQNDWYRNFRGIFVMDVAEEQRLIRVTEELHQCFLRAVDHVLTDRDRLRAFGLPDSMFGSLRASWRADGDLAMTGRFDFSVHGRDIKLYEYNTDSPACILETAQLQSRLLSSLSLPGVSAAQHLSDHLVEAWRAMETGPLIHLLRDNTAEECYHALFMKELIEASGKRAKIVVGTSGLLVDAGGFLVDPDGERLRFIWKTWSWSSVLRAIPASPPRKTRPCTGSDIPLLHEVLLHASLRVVEPLWHWLPSCKAILPVLWELFPGHPHLLPCFDSLHPALWNTGYASKPVHGRCGLNIELTLPRAGNSEPSPSSLVPPSDGLRVYQQLCSLPRIDQGYLQVHTFTVRGHYAGSGLRVSSHPVVDSESDCAPLCVAESAAMHAWTEWCRHA